MDDRHTRGGCRYLPPAAVVAMDAPVIAASRPAATGCPATAAAADPAVVDDDGTAATGGDGQHTGDIPATADTAMLPPVVAAAVPPVSLGTTTPPASDATVAKIFAARLCSTSCSMICTHTYVNAFMLSTLVCIVCACILRYKYM
ncbi:hypothetical protein Vafri_1824 [Volvox africanus]|nr:hypothetical protein Vafri_1824 [Volvox africanus]